jgi:hypothetical protein
MYTIDNASPAKLPIKEGQLIAIAFPTDATNLKEGAVVKLLNTGKVAVVAAATDVPVGIVEVFNDKYKDAATVTVRTHFQAIAKCLVDTTTTAIGDLVSVTGWDATAYKATVAPATAGDFVYGIALTGGDDTDPIDVGILRVPFRLGTGA